MLENITAEILTQVLILLPHTLTHRSGGEGLDARGGFVSVAGRVEDSSGSRTEERGPRLVVTININTHCLFNMLRFIIVDRLNWFRNMLNRRLFLDNRLRRRHRCRSLLDSEARSLLHYVVVHRLSRSRSSVDNVPLDTGLNMSSVR